MPIKAQSAVYKVPCGVSRQSQQNNEITNIFPKHFFQKVGVAVWHYQLSGNACQTFCAYTTLLSLGGPFRPILLNFTPWLRRLTSVQDIILQGNQNTEIVQHNQFANEKPNGSYLPGFPVCPARFIEPYVPFSFMPEAIGNFYFVPNDLISWPRGPGANELHLNQWLSIIKRNIIV